MTTHIHEAISQKLELVSSIVIHHWKAYDINFKVGFFLGVPFSLACTHILDPGDLTVFRTLKAQNKTR